MPTSPDATLTQGRSQSGGGRETHNGVVPLILKDCSFASPADAPWKGEEPHSQDSEELPHSNDFTGNKIPQGGGAVQSRPR